jgi:hypothetical protein
VQHSAIWGTPRTWPFGSTLVFSAVMNDGRYRPIGSCDASSSAQTAFEVWAPYARQGLSTYVGVSARAEKPRELTMGSADTVDYLDALVVDIDFSDGGSAHAAGERNPTREQADVWIAEAPVQPTLVIASGGGYHLWFALKTFVPVRSDAGVELVARHKNLWESIAAADSLNIDAGPLKNQAAGVLRTSGGWNRKQNAPVTLNTPTAGPRYSIEELLAVYPQLPPSRPTPISSPSIPSRANPVTLIAGRELTAEKVGDRFAMNVPVGDVCELLGAEFHSENTLSFPDSEGEISNEASATIYHDDDGIDRLTIFGSRVQRLLELEVGHRLTSWDLLGAMTGSFRNSAKLLSDWEVTPGVWDGLTLGPAILYELTDEVATGLGISRTEFPPMPPIKATRTATAASADITRTSELVSASIPVPVGMVDFDAGRSPLFSDIEPDDPYSNDSFTDVVDINGDDTLLATALGNGTDIVPVTSRLTLAEAVATRTNASFPMDGDLLAVLDFGDQNKGRHGIHIQTYKPDPLDPSRFITHTKQITSWVPYRSVESRQLTVNPNGAEIEVGDPVVSMTVVTEGGIVRERRGFTLAASRNVDAVADRMLLPISVPVDAASRGHLANVMRSLGGSAGGTRTVAQFGTMGWYLSESEGWVYLAPGGSMTQAGPTQSFAVGPPPHSDENSLNSAQLGYGFPRVPTSASDFEAAAASVGAFMELVRTENNACFALLGQMALGPLAIPGGGGSTFLAAVPGVGKSQLTAAAQAFLTSGWQTDFTGAEMGKASIIGAGLACLYARHATVTFDDYRNGKDSKKNMTMNSVLTIALQASYNSSGSSGAKGNVAGGLRSVYSSSSTGVLSGEGLPNEEGVVSRALSVQLERTDVNFLPLGNSKLEAFWGHADEARMFFGGYLQFLATRLNKLGTLKAFKEDNLETRAVMAPTDGGRSSQLAAGIGLGWSMLRAYADTNGVAHLLPSHAEVMRRVKELADSNRELVKDANPAVAIIDAIRAAIGTKEVYLQLHDERVPSKSDASRMGWFLSGTGDFSGYTNNRRLVGTLSPCRQWVLLKDGAVSGFKKTLGFADLPPSQLEAGFTTEVKEGTTPGGRAAPSLGLNRARGYVIAASRFDISDDPFEEKSPETNDNDH